MDSLRITLLIIGAVLIAVVYGWERVKRRKQHDRYARWGNDSGDPETDNSLVSSAYEMDTHFESIYDSPIEDKEQLRHFDEVDDANEVTTFVDEDINESFTTKIEENDEEDAWAVEVNASLDEAVTQDALEPDLDSDPEVAVNPIDDITSELEALEEMISQEPERGEMDLGDLNVATEQEAPAVPDRVIVVHILAKQGQTFYGADVLSSLLHQGLQFGDMNVFHSLDANNKSIFSLLNAVEPGIFDLSTMEDLKTPALLLMMTLPNPLPALEAYDGMLETARSLATSLDGRLCDETRSVLTRQAIDEARAELVGL